MKIKPTPGPWNVQGRHAMEISGPPGTYIVANIETPSDLESYATAQADARLIAAAPKLLEFVQRFAWFNDGPASRQAQALLKDLGLE